ncbi:MAG TPA: hypothetical protein VHD36_09420 [Pirellulales bacterium]|nr:hypothetical protein [Pirellulales bacterium]
MKKPERLAALLIMSFLAMCHSTPFVPSKVHAQTPETSLISDLVSNNWQKVRLAKPKFESQEADGIAAVIVLLDRDDFVPLTNTSDLIYPGAMTFYGHGRIVDYDLDRIAVRAGWVLEEAAFQNFGFSEGAIREEDLLQAAIKGKTDVPLKDVVPAKRDEASRADRINKARNRAKAWWSAAGKDWSRYAALKDALISGDAKREMEALGWLRHGETKCKGLNSESYERDLLPIVKKLVSAQDEGVAQQAIHLRGERGQWWRKDENTK